jgi:hypothetical protein
MQLNTLRKRQERGNLGAKCDGNPEQIPKSLRPHFGTKTIREKKKDVTRNC